MGRCAADPGRLGSWRGSAGGIYARHFRTSRRRRTDRPRWPAMARIGSIDGAERTPLRKGGRTRPAPFSAKGRSEEHTSELQSRGHLVCRLLLEKKKASATTYISTEYL